MRMAQPSRPREANARRELSGEMRGEREMVPRCVICVLILPVVVHRPDFFGAGAGADEVDFGFGDAVDAAAEAQDDLVGEAVGDGARRVLAGDLVVLLAEDLGADGVAGVEEPAGDEDAAVGGGERAEGDHGGIGRRGRPLRAD